MRSKLGKTFFLALVILTSCRKDYAPKTDLCELDGFGGADCVLKDGTTKYKYPSELQNWIARSPEEEAQFVAWCYKTNPEQIKEIWQTMKPNYYILHGK